MRKRLLTAAILGLSGCSSGIVNPIEPPLKWETLKDGSQLAIGDTDPSAREASALIRCWKAGTAYDCVAIQGNEWKDVRRTSPKTLPTAIWGKKEPIGYDCTIGGVGDGYQEHITGKAGRLTQHVAVSLGSLESSWSRDYVDRYLKANAIEPETLWYDCGELTVAIQAGSNATIGSTSVSRELLDGPPQPKQ
jgi:hypothetical protein